MVAWVFLVGIFNLALGYGVAAALSDPPPWEEWRLKLAPVPTHRAAMQPPPPELSPAPDAAPVLELGAASAHC